MKEQLFFVGVKGLIKNRQDEYLVLLADVTEHRKHTEPYWDIPGGRIEKGSNLLETLQREMSEETGITIDPATAEHCKTIISKHQIPISEGSAGLALVVYRVLIPAAQSITLSNEHVRYEWIGASEARKRLSNKYPQEFTDLL